MDTPYSAIVGIDLGTSYCSVAFFNDHAVKIISSPEGDNRIPTYVFSNDDFSTTIVGNPAKRLAHSEPQKAFFDFKRGALDKLGIRTKKVQNESEVTSTFLTSKVLIYLRTLAEDYFKQTIKQEVETTAVITVPAHFNYVQRSEIAQAANNAQITVIKLLDDPIAAALAYYYRRPSFKESDALVFDFGSSTSSITLIHRNDVNIKIIKTYTLNFGGENFDRSILDYIEHQVNNNLQTKIDIMKLTKEIVEGTKKRLSTMNAVDVSIQIPEQNLETTVKVTRNIFENMLRDTIVQIISTTDKCLVDANLTKIEIDDVIMVGGSMRIPKIQEAISKYFSEKCVVFFDQPDLCVAEGAALQGGMLSNLKNIGNLQLTNTIPLSIGISDHLGLGIRDVILKKDSSIPCHGNDSLKIFIDGESDWKFDIYEGERYEVKYDHWLGTIKLTNKEPRCRREAIIEIEMSLGFDGSLSVILREQNTDNEEEKMFCYIRGIRNEEEITKALRVNVRTENQVLLFAHLKGLLLEYCKGILFYTKPLVLDIDEKEVIKFVQRLLKDIPKYKIYEKKSLKVTLSQIQQACQPIIIRYSILISTKYYKMT